LEGDSAKRTSLSKVDHNQLDESGHICTINTSPLQKTGNKIEVVVADFTGEALLFSDSLGNVFLALIYNNRFLSIATNARAYTLQFLDLNRLLFAVATHERNVRVYNNQGTLVETLKGHKAKVTHIETNFTRQLLMTQSKDSIHLWNLKTFAKIRILYPRQQPFRFGMFTRDNDHLFSRFIGEKLYLWDLGSYDMVQEFDISLALGLLALCGDSKTLLAAGDSPTFSHINLKTREQITVQLPHGNTHCTKIETLANFRIAILLCDDHKVYFVDIDRNYSVICSLSSRSKKYIDFTVDRCSNLIACINNEGEAELYRTKTLISHDFQKKGDELKKGGDSLNRVQSLLPIVERVILSDATKPSKANKEVADPEEETAVIDERKLLRENWVPGHSTAFNLKDLRSFLKKHRVLPDQHRGVVWSYLLNLPRNVLCYDNYIKKGVHKAFEDLDRTFPLKNPQLTKKLGRVLSALAHYSPAFAEKHLIPFVVFPFVKLLGQDECGAFEVALTFMMHWGQHFLENFPHPSTCLIEYAYECLQFNDPQLAQHFKAKDVKLGDYLWSGWTNLYTDLLPRSEWLVLFDTLVAYPEYPEMFILLGVAELIYKREAFLSVQSPEQLKAIIEHLRIDNVKSLLKMSTELLYNTIKAGGKEYPYKRAIPLSEGSYQPYLFLPKALL
jgi:hypothetical protein